jgi:hypothetical protein
MPFWKIQDVTQQPNLTLVDWRVIETNKEERHFIGLCPECVGGRVSTAIQSFDQKSMRGLTRSGRVYQLVGPPGMDPDAIYVLNAWLEVNQVEMTKDVTEELLQLPTEPPS